MPFNGQGVYQPDPTVFSTSGTVVASAPYNAHILDVSAALNTPVPVARGGTGAASATAARAALDLEIGVDVQGFSANLGAFSNLSPVSDRLAYFTSSTAMALVPFSNIGREIIGQQSKATARTYLEVPSNSEAVLQTQVGTGANQVVRLDASAKLPSIDGSNLTGLNVPVRQAQLYHLTGGDAGTLGQNVWQTRVLNVEFDPYSIVTLASNTFTTTVDCIVEWSVPGYDAKHHISKLYDVTGAADVKRGTAEFSSENQSHSMGRAFVSAGRQYRIDHKASEGNLANGLGRGYPGETNVFAQVTLTQI